MSKRLNDLRFQRNALVVQAREVLTHAEKESRGLNPEEKIKYDAIFAAQDGMRSTIEAEERQIEAERGSAKTEMAAEEKRDGQASGPRSAPEYREAVNQFIREGRASLNGDHIRALSAGAGSEGGFLILPEQDSGALIQAVDNEVLIRQWATKFTVTTSASLGAVSLDADPSDSDWTSELATGLEDSAMAFGKRELVPNPLAKRIKISEKMLRHVPKVEGLVISRLGYKFGVTEEKAYLLGNGAKRPLGLFVASNDGVPTSRDVSTGNSTAAMTYAGLVNAKYSLKSSYQQKAKWLLHRDGVAQLAGLLDTTGRPLWVPSMIAGQPDLLLGIPLYQSEYVPNTYTTGQYVGIIGDFSQYWIADALDVRIQRLTELYAESGQIGFIGRKEGDGMPVLAEAFTRIKLA